MDSEIEYTFSLSAFPSAFGSHSNKFKSPNFKCSVSFIFSLALHSTSIFFFFYGPGGFGQSSPLQSGSGLGQSSPSQSGSGQSSPSQSGLGLGLGQSSPSQSGLGLGLGQSSPSQSGLGLGLGQSSPSQSGSGLGLGQSSPSQSGLGLGLGLTGQIPLGQQSSPSQGNIQSGHGKGYIILH